MLLKGEIKVKSVPNPHQPNPRINSLLVLVGVL